MRKPYYNIVKNEAANEATIYIYGAIGELDPDTWELKNTASKFTTEFKELEKTADTIHVRINSPGGYVFEGAAIFNALTASKKHIITYNDGLAASMGFVILLAGDEIKAFPNALGMCHNSSSIYYGNKKEVEEQLKMADKVDAAMGTALENRLGITAEEVAEKYLNYKDNWYTAAEALEIGFYDEIITSDKKEPAPVPQDIMNMSFDERVKKYAAMSFDHIPAQTPPQKPRTMSKPTSFPSIEAALGLKSPLAVTENGSYLNEEQKTALEHKLSANATTIKNATEAQATAETALATAKTNHTAALETANAATTAATDELRAAATLAGAEDLSDDAPMEDIVAALTEKINALNAAPGEKHTAGAKKENPDGEHAYLDFANSIYKIN